MFSLSSKPETGRPTDRRRRKRTYSSFGGRDKQSGSRRTTPHSITTSKQTYGWVGNENIQRIRLLPLELTSTSSIIREMEHNEIKAQEGELGGKKGKRRNRAEPAKASPFFPIRSQIRYSLGVPQHTQRFLS